MLDGWRNGRVLYLSVYYYLATYFTYRTWNTADDSCSTESSPRILKRNIISWYWPSTLWHSYTAQNNLVFKREWTELRAMNINMGREKASCPEKSAGVGEYKKWKRQQIYWLLTAYHAWTVHQDSISAEISLLGSLIVQRLHSPLHQQMFFIANSNKFSIHALMSWCPGHIATVGKE